MTFRFDLENWTSKIQTVNRVFEVVQPKNVHNMETLNNHKGKLIGVGVGGIVLYILYRLYNIGGPISHY